MLNLLKDYFGHDSFRKLQKEAIDRILSGGDLLMILPTGGGKSVCYQLPSLMMRGVTIVISPLLALMHDQVSTLKSMDIPAEMISSLQEFEEIKEIQKRLFRREIKLLYVSPERLTTPYFLDILSRLDINFFVIDEAHCVSEWGHEFREDYRKLGILKERFPNIPISAFTATATESVKQDIITALKLNEPLILKGKLFRENLKISVRERRGDGRGQLLEFLKSQKELSGIVYTLSRRKSEVIAEFLRDRGYKARAFHARLDSQEKKRVYQDFIDDKIDIVVATIAFGMGIDKSNIRFVVHLSMPKTIENYYQEIGRAGRDGLDSQTLLLFSIEDKFLQHKFVDELEDGVYKQSILAKIDRIYSYCESNRCRHQDIAIYFDDMIDECIDKCDNCLSKDIKRADITKEAQMMLSAIYRTSQQYGVTHIIDILRGSKKRVIFDRKENELSVYGIGKKFSKEQWRSVSHKLLEIEAIYQGEHKELILTQKGAEILRGKESVTIPQDRIKKPKRVKLSQNIQEDNPLLNRLRELRREIATASKIPPYVVFSDRTLYELLQKLPKTKDEMLEIYGVGRIKYEKYGEQFLEIIKEFLDEKIPKA